MRRVGQETERSWPSAQRWPKKVPDVVWAPLATSALILLVGLIGLGVHRPWLFASLGPTAFLQVETPDHPTSRFYNVVFGHLIGLAAGFLAVVLVRAGNDPSVLTVQYLTTDRVWASVLAMALTMLGLLLLRAPHPPAASTTLLIALGGFKPTVDNALIVMAGVLIVATAGEALRRMRLGQLMPAVASRARTQSPPVKQ
jgi:CBS-domain-containing membrane protein